MGLSVMIVDDNEADRYLLKRQLEETGLDIVNIFEEEDGEYALSFLGDYDNNAGKYSGRFPPNIIFLDINMPLVSGPKFLEEFLKIREHGGLSSVVIMMFSSSEIKDDIDLALSYPFVKDYLIKGNFSTETLRSRVEKSFSSKVD